jgi:hypothetical protein
MKEQDKKVRSKNILGAHQLLAFQDYLATAKVKDRDYENILALNATFVLCLYAIRTDVGGFDN